MRPQTGQRRLSAGPGSGADAAARWALGAVLFLMVAVEIALAGAELGFWGHPGWRPTAWRLLSFRPSLWWGTGQAYYPGQSVIMVPSYLLVHLGPLHLLGNLLPLALFLRLGRGDLAPRQLLLVLGLSALAGAVGFALLAPADIDMTGASALVFGLGAHIGVSRMRTGGASGPGWVPVLACLGLALSDMVQTGSAWQAHLGGALCGAWLAWARAGGAGAGFSR